MAFWVHGRDQSGDETESIFSEASTEEEARAAGVARGMVVESVERVENRAPAADPPQGPLPLAGPATLGRPAEAQYEFTKEQDQVIAGLGRSMRFVGMALTVVGGFGILVGLFGGAPRNVGGALVQGALNILIGIFTVGIGNSFQKVVDTRGNDLGHLMEALESLGALYGLLKWLVLLAVVLLGAAFLFLGIGRLSG